MSATLVCCIYNVWCNKLPITQGGGGRGGGGGGGGQMGPLMGGPQCHLSILRNGNVPCCYFQIFPVGLKIIQCPLSISKNNNVPCRYFSNVPVDFKIVQCRLSTFKNDNVSCCYFSNVPVDFKVVQCRLSNLRKHCVALSILRVKGPQTEPIVTS